MSDVELRGRQTPIEDDRDFVSDMARYAEGGLRPRQQLCGKNTARRKRDCRRWAKMTPS